MMSDQKEIPMKISKAREIFNKLQEFRKQVASLSIDELEILAHSINDEEFSLHQELNEIHKELSILQHKGGIVCNLIQTFDSNEEQEDDWENE